ncbi:siderophore-interacting protein [Salinibacterium sp. NK8237]|uniref:siderophore-interacting protein n=1 Tax=Salinibacterium sp. NK8237 TaxID=2792038 RepID=UPI0018CD8825|nr:siderophore-interacting protein [Salinibacterium sp. NK8237]MBH0130116.1 siderophore-interacting protein [Salinibacterium sp. NK8237]
MLTLEREIVKDARPGYRPFAARVESIRELSPHFKRVTFAGAEFEAFGTDGFDQRIKIVFPLPGIGLSDIGAHDPQTIAEGTWYARWRALPDEARNPFRTYTIRAVRPELREIDVDMVFHGANGPAGQWLANAAAGDEVIIVGPDAASIHSGIGIDWHPGPARTVLLAGDETSAPAICNILERLDPSVQAHAFIEIPDAADQPPLNLTSNCHVTWLPRGEQPAGSALDPAVRAWTKANASLVLPALAPTPQLLGDIDVDTELLWDSPGEASGKHFYAWLAAEACTIKLLRRFLVSETGVDRKQVAFMGYWRLGKSEAQ